MGCCPPAQYTASRGFIPSCEMPSPQPPPYPGYNPLAQYYGCAPSWSSFFGVPRDFSGQLNIFPGTNYPGYAPPQSSCPSYTGYPPDGYSQYNAYAPRYTPPPHKSSKKDEKPTGEAATEAPGKPNGAQYLYPKSHLLVMTPTDGSKPWEKQNESFPSSMFQVPTNFTVKEMIEQLGGGKDHVVTEFSEKGGGLWQKGLSIAHTSDQAKERLDSSKVGWTGARGTDEDPLRLAFHM